jgi:hypothetical protein
MRLNFQTRTSHSKLTTLEAGYPAPPVNVFTRAQMATFVLFVVMVEKSPLNYCPRMYDIVKLN